MPQGSDTYVGIKGSVKVFLDGNSLKARVFRGGAWLGAGSLVEQLFRFGRNMLLTRLLAPEAFGTMAIILSTTSMLQSLTDVGAKEALIQNPRGTEEGHAGAAWWLSFGRSLSIYLGLFLLAPFIARFYGSAELAPLLRVATIGLLFEGGISSKAYVAMKEMKFRKWALVNHGGAISGVVITVILSFFIRDVWALVIGYCAENAARCVLSYALCPFCPPVPWDNTAIRELLKFSRGLFGLSLLNLIFARADIFVLAKVYSSAQLGLYAMAVYLVQTPTNFGINLFAQTLLPTFSHIQEDKDRMNRILLRATSATVLLGMPILFFLFFCGHSVLTLVYGQRYSAAAPALIAAGCVALLNLANSQITTVFYAKGLPQLHRRSVLIMAILMIALIYPFVKEFGLVGGQLACIISILVGYLLQIERVHHVTGLNLSQYGNAYLISLAASFGVVVVWLATRSFVIAAQPLPNIILGITGCLIAYGIASAIFFRGVTGVALGVAPRTVDAETNRSTEYSRPETPGRGVARET